MINRQFALFAIAGAIGFLVDVAVLYAALACGFNFFSGRGLSFLAAVWTTWVINRRHAFRQQAAKSIFAEWWRYFCSMLGGASVNYVTYSLIVIHLHNGRFVPLIGVAFGSIAGIFVNFFAAKHWVFRR